MISAYLVRICVLHLILLGLPRDCRYCIVSAHLNRDCGHLFRWPPGYQRIGRGLGRPQFPGFWPLRACRMAYFRKSYTACNRERGIRFERTHFFLVGRLSFMGPVFRPWPNCSNGVTMVRFLISFSRHAALRDILRLSGRLERVAYPY